MQRVFRGRGTSRGEDLRESDSKYGDLGNIGDGELGFGILEPIYKEYVYISMHIHSEWWLWKRICVGGM